MVVLNVISFDITVKFTYIIKYNLRQVNTPRSSLLRKAVAHLHSNRLISEYRDKR